MQRTVHSTAQCDVTPLSVVIRATYDPFRARVFRQPGTSQAPRGGRPGCQPENLALRADVTNRTSHNTFPCFLCLFLLPKLRLLCTFKANACGWL